MNGLGNKGLSPAQKSSSIFRQTIIAENAGFMHAPTLNNGSQLLGVCGAHVDAGFSRSSERLPTTRAWSPQEAGLIHVRPVGTSKMKASRPKSLQGLRQDSPVPAHKFGVQR